MAEKRIRVNHRDCSDCKLEADIERLLRERLVAVPVETQKARVRNVSKQILKVVREREAEHG